MIFNAHYPYIGGEKATIVVSAPTGSTVTATLGTTVLRTTEKNGVWTFNVRAFGVWTINATLGSESAQTAVNVTQDTTYNVLLSYTNPADGVLLDNSGNAYVPVTNVTWSAFFIKGWVINKGATASLDDVTFASTTTTLTFVNVARTGFDVSIDGTKIGTVTSANSSVNIPSNFIGGAHTISIKNKSTSAEQGFDSLSFNV